MKCENCKGSGHDKANCWAKGGGKEGQGPRSQRGKREEKRPETAAIVDTRHNVDDLFMFTCTSDYADVTNALNIPKSQLGTCIDSGASHHYSPHHNAFTDYPIHNWGIMTADGQKLKAVGMSNIVIELPNGAKRTKIILKDTIYTPDMAFTLISVSHLDEANRSTTFSGGMCTIKSVAGCTIATIPQADGLYCILPAKDPPIVDYANVASVKWTISEVHQKLGHIVHSAISYVIAQGCIQLDPNSKPEFCEPCAKAKLTWQPFPKESETRASEYGEHIHWDLWEPAAVKILSGNLYVAACIVDASCETTLYFQVKNSQTIDSYKRNEALIETQTSNQIKVLHSD